MDGFFFVMICIVIDAENKTKINKTDNVLNKDMNKDSFKWVEN